MESWQLGALFTATRYRPVRERQAIWFRLNGFAGRSEVENVPLEGSRLINDDLGVFEARATVGHSLFLVQSRKKDRVRDLRWESELAVFANRTTPDFDQVDNPLNGLRVTSSLAYRNRWGVFRLGFSYFASESR